jgi:hypothetical protein
MKAKKFVRINFADFYCDNQLSVSHNSEQFDDEYYQNESDDYEFDDYDDDEFNTTIGIVKYKNKYKFKKGASSQNYFDAEALDFQYKTKKQIEYEEFLKDFDKEMEIEYQNDIDDLINDDFFIRGNDIFDYYDLPHNFIFDTNTRNVGKNTVIHTFEQNSHDKNIHSSLNESISKINTFTDWISCINDAKKYFGIEFVHKYMDWKEYDIQVVYGKIWSRILSYDLETKLEAINILKSEIIAGYHKCLTGRINRIISSLCGIDNDIQQKISLSQQFTLIFDALRQKYSNIDIFSNKFIELFRIECIERKIDINEIELYIQSINS